jgi:hypothetical protein
MNKGSLRTVSTVRTVPDSPVAEKGVTDGGTAVFLKLALLRLEYLADYESDGHHPVHLGDLLGNDGRYRVIHKHDHGGFANVWLCRAV